MIVDVGVGGVVLAIAENDQHAVGAAKLTEQLSALVVVKSAHGIVKPHLAASEGAHAVALEVDAVDGILGYDITLRHAPLDGEVGKIDVEGQSLYLLRWLESDMHHLGLAVGVTREIDHLAAGSALGDVILAVAGDAGDEETLHHVGTLLAVAVDDIVDSALVVFLKHRHMHYLGLLALSLGALGVTHEELIGHAGNLVGAVAVEDNHVVEVGAGAHQLVLLERGAYEALLAVDIQLLVLLRHLDGLNLVESRHLSIAGIFGAVFFLEVEIPVDGHLLDILEVAVHLAYLALQAQDVLLGLVLVEAEDALHLYLQQSQYVVLGHLAHHLGVPRRQALVDMLTCLVGRFGVLILLILIDALIDEDALQRGVVQLLQQLLAVNHQLLPQQAARLLNAVAQHVAHRKELRRAVVDYAAVGRDAHLAVGEGVEGVERLVGRNAGLQVDHNARRLRGRVVDMLDLYLALLAGSHD